MKVASSAQATRPLGRPPRVADPTHRHGECGLILRLSTDAYQVVAEDGPGATVLTRSVVGGVTSGE
jgi:hypothetical protein